MVAKRATEGSADDVLLDPGADGRADPRVPHGGADDDEIVVARIATLGLDGSGPVEGGLHDRAHPPARTLALAHVVQLLDVGVQRGRNEIAEDTSRAREGVVDDEDVVRVHAPIASTADASP